MLNKIQKQVLNYQLAKFGQIVGNAVTNVLFLASIIIGFWAIGAMRFKVSIFPNISKNNSHLVVIGPYKYVRHPMYTAVILAALSWVLNKPSQITIVLFIFLFLVLVFKSRYEEALLEKHFPNYDEYRQKTKRFIPFIY